MKKLIKASILSISILVPVLYFSHSYADNDNDGRCAIAFNLVATKLIQSGACTQKQTTAAQFAAKYSDIQNPNEHGIIQVCHIPLDCGANGSYDIYATSSCVQTMDSSSQGKTSMPSCSCQMASKGEYCMVIPK
ncbi:MAG: hypothetical protein K0U23_00790 [Gammaproteobacteria bacterium]|nr:hypothetical protein [Gammaproteobacteria bacterium]